MTQETLEKINIAEILRDCPKGMELYSPVCGKCTLENVSNDLKYPILVYTTDIVPFYFSTDGRYFCNLDAECLLFPSKDQRDWSKFQGQFKDGDILSNGICICIYNGNESKNHYGLYVGVGHIDYPDYFIVRTQNSYFTKENTHLATEEEKEKLFQAIKEKGYKWNADKKKLEKLIEPKFKVGDRVREKGDQSATFTISDIDDACYYCGEYVICNVCDQDNYELVPNKFEITTLVPFESKVLVREKETDVWQPAFYGFFNQHNKRFYTTSTTWLMCIPYNEDTKHLIGTKSDCNKYYKTWEK